MSVKTYNINTLIQLNSGLFVYAAEKFDYDPDAEPDAEPDNSTVSVIHRPIVQERDSRDVASYKILKHSIEYVNEGYDAVFFPFDKDSAHESVVVARNGMLHNGNILPDTYVTIRGKDCVSVLVVMLEALVSHTYPLNAIYVVQDDEVPDEGEDDDDDVEYERDEKGEGEGEEESSSPRKSEIGLEDRKRIRRL